MSEIAPDCAPALSAWVEGSERPELSVVDIGFIPLTDCASVVMAHLLGFDQKYGLRFNLIKEPSWAVVRDKLVAGDLHAAQALYGMAYGVHMGVGGPRKNMALLMTLSHNGQAISLSNELRDKKVTSGAALARLIAKKERCYTFAQTFPTGTHAMWLYYWLAAHGIHPFQDIKTIVVPPAQMVSNMRIGNMDGACMGEPWNQRLIADNIGFTVATSQSIWPDHPEKVLAASADFVAHYPRTARAMICAVLEASRWIDASPLNRSKTAEAIAAKAYVNTDTDVIRSRMIGQYENGLGKRWTDAHAMRFYNDGQVNFPYLSDGMWFLTQHKRWGMLKGEIDYLGIARQINQIDLYRQAAQIVQVPLPASPMRSASLMDGVVWNGENPQAYLEQFKIRA